MSSGKRRATGAEPGPRRGGRLAFVEEALPVGALVLMAAIPLLEALLRPIRPGGIPGSAMWIQHLALWVGFLGGAVAARRGELLALTARSERVARALEGKLRLALRSRLGGRLRGPRLRQRPPDPRRVGRRSGARAGSPGLGSRGHHADRLSADRVAALAADSDPVGPAAGRGGNGGPGAAPRGDARAGPGRERDRLAAVFAGAAGCGLRSAYLHRAGRRRRGPPLEQLRPGFGDRRRGLQHGQQADVADHPAVHAGGLHPGRGRGAPPAWWCSSGACSGGCPEASRSSRSWSRPSSPASPGAAASPSWRWAG